MREVKVSGLCGWGRFPRVDAHGVVPEFQDDLKQLATGNNQLLLARGCGKSYGDAAIDSESSIVWMEELNRLNVFDALSGLLRCEAGLTLDNLLQKTVPEGWFVPVLPGTTAVTVGGAIAADIHGKNHHQDGSFSNFVKSMKMILADGKTVNVSRESNLDLFRATTGGMGLTGIITEAEIQLRAIETAWIVLRRMRCANLDETMQKMQQFDHEYQYCVGWIDCLAGGANLGRSVLMLGRHALKSDTSRSTPHATAKLRVPFEMPTGLLNNTTISLFNELYYGYQSETPGTLVPWEKFFCPLDAIHDWNRIYGRNGFIQYQFVVPQANSRAALEEVLWLCSKSGLPSFLCVLKRLKAGHGLLNFPLAGYTLAMDFPMRPGVTELTSQLDTIVIKYGGRVYLAKDSCLTPTTFRRMYEEFPDWLAVKKAVDPQGRFTSHLARRLQLDKA